jgi:hypothetical protein
MTKESKMSKLVPQHLEDLRRSGLTDETIEMLGFYSATEAQVKAILGFDAGEGLSHTQTAPRCQLSLGGDLRKHLASVLMPLLLIRRRSSYVGGHMCKKKN